MATAMVGSSLYRGRSTSASTSGIFGLSYSNVSSRAAARPSRPPDEGRQFQMTVKRRSAVSDKADLFAGEHGLPAGFDYREDVISSGEELAMVERFAALPFQPFEFHGYLAKRRLVSFGWRYDYAGARLRDSDAIPPFLLPLRGRAAAFAGVPADSLQQIPVTEYAPGAALRWHPAKPTFQVVRPG